MKVKTSELAGPALDWAVAKCVHVHVRRWPDGRVQFLHPNTDWTDFKVDWTSCGPIIEQMGNYYQEGDKEEGSYYCSTPSVAEPWHNHPVSAKGSTPLIAAMRCYVASKLGDEVDVPEKD